MDLAKKMYISMEAYFSLKQKSEVLMEYIDGTVYMAPSPSTKHQRICGRLQLKLGNYLQGKSCEVFGAPYDIELKHEDFGDSKIIIPDISVICDKSGFTEARYVGIPVLIMEVLSPSNQSHDLITKMHLYMKFGVKEYWIVNPMLESITVYTLNAEMMYEQFDMKVGLGILRSSVLEGFFVELSELFSKQ